MVNSEAYSAIGSLVNRHWLKLFNRTRKSVNQEVNPSPARILAELYEIE